MHELPISQNILKIALRYGDESKAKRITDLYLVIGQLSSIIDDSIQFYWPIISKGTIAEDAILHFKRIPAKLECAQCGTSYLIEDGNLTLIEDGNLTTCPTCDSSQIKILTGKEFQLESIGIND